MRKIFIGLTIILAIIWTPFLIWPLIIVSGEYAKTAVDWLQAYTRDSESESFVDTQVGKYHLEIPRRFIRNDSTLVFGPEVNNTNPVELAVKMVIPAQEMAAAVPGYSARVGYLPLDLLFYISAPSTKTLNKDLSPNFFNNLWRGEGAFRNSVVQPDSAVGLYRIYSGMHMSELSRDTGLPVRWTYTSLPPDPFFSVPKDPLGFWVAACKTGQWLRLDHYSQDAAVCHAKLFASGLYVTIDLHGTNFHLLESIKSFLAASIQKWISANAQPPGVSHEQDGNTDPSEPTVTDRPNSDVGSATTKRTGSDADYFTQQSPSAEATARLAEKSHSSPPAHHWQLSPETSAGIVSIGPGGEAALEQLVQGAAFTGAQAHSWFGRVMAISADGSTLAVGAPSQDGAERSGSCDPGLTHSRFRWVGAVYLYRRAREGGWRYDDCLRPTRASKHESFASSIALSADGSTLAVGAPGAKPIERKHNKELFFGPDGAVYLYKRHRDTWTDIQRIEPEQSYASTFHIHFGASVGLSADGNTLAVGAPADDFNKPGIQHFAQSPPPEEPIYQRNKFSGAVYMYIWDDARGYQKPQWQPQAYIKPSHVQPGDRFGESLALSLDGNTLAVGAPSGVINAIYVDWMHQRAGAAYVFNQRAEQWHQTAKLKPSDTAPGDRFGASVSLDANGRTLAIGAIRAGGANDYKFLSEKLAEQAWKKETTQTRKIQTTQNFEESATQVRERLTTQVQDRPSAQTQKRPATQVQTMLSAQSSIDAGATYLFMESGGNWTEQARLRPPEPGHNDQFGVSTAIAADGNFVVVGAPGKNCPLLLATQGQQSLSGCGAVYVYERSGLDWPLQSRYFPTGAGAYNRLGSSVAIDSKAGHAAAGATGWDTQASSARTDEPHPQTDNEGVDGGSNSDGDGDGGNSGNSDTNGDNNSNSGADTVDVGSDYIDTDNDNIDTGAVFIWPIQNH